MPRATSISPTPSTSASAKSRAAPSAPSPATASSAPPATADPRSTPRSMRPWASRSIRPATSTSPIPPTTPSAASPRRRHPNAPRRRLRRRHRSAARRPLPSMRPATSTSRIPMNARSPPYAPADGSPSPAAASAATAAMSRSHPTGVAADAAGNVYVADLSNNRVRTDLRQRRPSPPSPAAAARAIGGDNGPATSALLNTPRPSRWTRAGNLYIADTGNNRVRLVSTAGPITHRRRQRHPRLLTAMPASPSARRSATDRHRGRCLGQSLHQRRQHPHPQGLHQRLHLDHRRRRRPRLLRRRRPRLHRAVQWRPPPWPSIPPAISTSPIPAINAIRRLSARWLAASAISAVTNGASNQTGVIAPGEVVALYGSGMGPGLVRASSLNAARVP